MEKISSGVSTLLPEDNEADRKLLVAVDFGTTYSGVAWAQTRRVGLLHQTRTALLQMDDLSDYLSAGCANYYHTMARCGLQWPRRCQ